RCAQVCSGVPLTPIQVCPGVPRCAQVCPGELTLPSRQYISYCWIICRLARLPWCAQVCSGVLRCAINPHPGVLQVPRCAQVCPGELTLPSRQYISYCWIICRLARLPW
ncbi:hypothetical protein DV515_00019632, partial [Chloebia gouldiae]